MIIGLVIYGSLDTVSGGYFYDRKLVEYLRAQGDTVEIISLPWRNYAAHLTDNLHFQLPRNLDLVIEDELNHPSLLAANRKPHPYPVVSLVHHLRSSEMRPAWQNRFYRRVEARYLRSVDGFIFNSKTTEGVVRDLIGPDKPSIVAYPPTDKFNPQVPEDEIRRRAAAQKLRLIFIGNIIPRKGLHTLLEALRLSTFDFHLDIVGSLKTGPQYARQLQKTVKTTSLKSKVCFTGPLTEQQLTRLLRSAHLLAVPSSYEGYGIVYLEAMSFGLPAIGTTAGAAGEIINDGATGYLIEPGDARMLAARLESLAADRELLVRLSLNALERYRSQPKWGETAEKIGQFLRKMASKS